MAESDSSIWQWCNARRKISKGRRGAIGLASDHAFNQQNENENLKQAARCDTSSHGSVFPCDFSNECKNSDGQWLPDLVDQPTTPDLDSGPLNTRKLDKSRFNGGTQRGSIASSPSSSVCEQADSSSCASITHDDVVEGMLIQSTDFSLVPSSRNKEMCHEELGSVFRALKHERFDVASPEKNLKADHSFRSGRPTLRNLRTVGIRKNKSIVSTSGLDLLVNAIFLLENCYADLMAWGSKDLQVHEQPITRPFFHAGLQKKRVIRRAKSAYRHRYNAQESLQSQEPELLKAIDSKPNLKGNHFCELGFGQMAESNQNQCLGGISEFIHEDQAVQSPLTSKLRRSVRGVHAKHYNFVAHPVKTGSILWTAYSSDYTESSIMLRRIRLESDGSLRTYGWVKRSRTWQLGWSAIKDQCQVYRWCGNFGLCVYNDTSPYCTCPSADFVPTDPKDPTQGCRRLQDLTRCINQSMVVLNHTQFFSYPPESDSKSDIYYLGIHDCEQNYCLRNPLCVASTVMADGSSIFRIKTENFTSAYQSAALPSTSYVKVCGEGHPLAPPPPAIRTVNSSKVSAIAIAAAVVVPIIALITIQKSIWWIFCRNNPRFRFGQLPAQYSLLDYASGTLVQFSYKELQQSTRNFTQKLGSCGFGIVYKGELSNKTIIIVKQLEGIEQGERHFHMEVATISSTHHLNLVRLIGFFSEGRHRLLVYEFMKNSSLDTFLFTSPEQSRILDWDKRFGIALGTARGVTYLHKECRDCIVHCDIKPENILLDDNFNAKVSDFGLSKLITNRGHQKRMLTSVEGTRGYLALEWLANLPIITKSNVYSYGMVLLEIIGGTRNFNTKASRRKKFSVWAYEEFERENILNITDEKLGGDINIDQVKRALQVSFWCIQEQPSQRPTMGKVVQMLEGILPIDKPPAPKSLESFESSTSGSASELALSVFATSSHPVSSMSSVNATLSSNL